MGVSRRFLIGLVTLVATTGVLAGCSLGSSDGDGAGESPLTLEQILTDSAAAMTEVSSATFMIEHDGGPVFIDEAGQIAFLAADGRYAEPASADAIVTVEAFGFVTEVGVVAIGGDLWFTNPLSGEWMEAPDGFTFDPATLFDPDLGIPAVLREATGQAELVTDGSPSPDTTSGDGDDPPTGETPPDAGEPTPDAEGRYRVRTTVPAERVSVLTGGLVAAETETVLVIDAETNRVAEVVFDLPLADTVSTWSLVITGYDTDVVIEAPQVGASG